MALLRTRTRTQRTLTRLAQRTAEVHGELAFVARLLGEMPEHRAVLEARRQVLMTDRDALYVTLRQFDPDIAPTEIGESTEWWKKILPQVRTLGLGARYVVLFMKT